MRSGDGVGCQEGLAAGSLQGREELVNIWGGLAQQRKEGGASAKALRPEIVAVFLGAIKVERVQLAKVKQQLLAIYLWGLMNGGWEAHPHRLLD